MQDNTEHDAGARIAQKYGSVVHSFRCFLLGNIGTRSFIIQRWVMGIKAVVGERDN